MIGFVSPTALHTKGENTRSFIVYSVWNNETDELIIIDGEARECAKAMGLAFSSFYSAVTKARSGKVKKWTIKERYLDGRKRYTKWERKGGANMSDYEQLKAQAGFVCCPMCDEEVCVGRESCEELKRYSESHTPKKGGDE